VSSLSNQPLLTAVSLSPNLLHSEQQGPRIVCCLVVMREARSAHLNTTVAAASIFGKPHESETLTCSRGSQLKSTCPPRPPPMLQSPPLETSPQFSSILAWLPTQVAMPTASSTDVTIAAARDLTTALQYPSPASPLSPTSYSQVATLSRACRHLRHCHQYNTDTIVSHKTDRSTWLPRTSTWLPALLRAAPAPAVPPPPIASKGGSSPSSTTASYSINPSRFHPTSTPLPSVAPALVAAQSSPAAPASRPPPPPFPSIHCRGCPLPHQYHQSSPQFRPPVTCQHRTGIARGRGESCRRQDSGRRERRHQ
jgi:hypothetical protein